MFQARNLHVILLAIAAIGLVKCDSKSGSGQLENKALTDSANGVVISDGSAQLAVADDSTQRMPPPQGPSEKELYERFLFESKVPLEVRDVLSKLDNKYQFYFRMNPFYLRGDFNGDGYFDVAILITERSSGKRGMLIYHSKLDEAHVLGAGNRFERKEDPPDPAAFDDFDWLNIWFVYGKREVEQGVTEEETIELTGEAIYAEKAEAAGGLIYWDGKGYYFYQQGD